MSDPMTDKGLRVQNGAWSTEHELEFLRSIATHNEASIRLGEAKVLRGYLVGLRKRARWGEINKTRIENYVISRLQTLRVVSQAA